MPQMKYFHLRTPYRMRLYASLVGLLPVVSSACDTFNDSEMYHALLRLDFKCVGDVISRHADDIRQVNTLLSAHDSCGRTVAHFMASQPVQSMEVMCLWETLNHYDVPINMQDQLGLTPLHVAVRYGFSQFVLALIASKADTHIPDIKGNMPLDSVFIKSDTLLITELGLCLTDATGKDGGNALGLSLFHNQIGVFKNVLASYLQQDVTYARSALEHGDTHGNTSLHTLAKLRGQAYDHELSETLLGLGIKLNTRNAFGWTPLYTAVLYQNLSFIQCLLTRGANGNCSETKGNTPLHLSMMMLAGNTSSEAAEIVKTLRTHTDVLLLNDAGVTPRDLLAYLWAQDLIADDVKKTLDDAIMVSVEKEKQRLMLPSYEKKRIFHHTFSSLLTAYFDARRQEICGEVPPRKNMICFSNALNLVGNALSFSGAGAISAVLSSLASEVEDQLYLKHLTQSMKGLDGLARMNYEVEKLSYALLRRYGNHMQRLGGREQRGVIQFAQYTANRVKKYLNRGLYQPDQTFTRQILDAVVHMEPIVDTLLHRVRVMTMGESYLEPKNINLTARHLLTHPTPEHASETDDV